MSAKLIKTDYLDKIKNFINVSMRIGSVNANDFIDTGIYAINSASSTCYNFPFTNPNGMLETYKGDVSCIKQVFTQNGGDSFLRLYWYGTWSSWRSIN